MHLLSVARIRIMRVLRNAYSRTQICCGRSCVFAKSNCGKCCCAATTTRRYSDARRTGCVLFLLCFVLRHCFLPTAHQPHSRVSCVMLPLLLGINASQGSAFRGIRRKSEHARVPFVFAQSGSDEMCWRVVFSFFQPLKMRKHTNCWRRLMIRTRSIRLPLALSQIDFTRAEMQIPPLYIQVVSDLPAR